MKRWYVGKKKIISFVSNSLPRSMFEAFESEISNDSAMYMQYCKIYKFVIGPFQTKEGAEYMVHNATMNNRICYSVEDAELGARMQVQSYVNGGR